MSVKYALVTDFDGTITTFDMAHRIVQYYSGARSDPYAAAPAEDGRSWMSRNMKAVKAGREEFETFVLTHAKARAGLLGLIKAAFGAGVPVEIVSGGVDLYINPFLLRHKITGLAVLSAKGTYGADGIELDFSDFAGLELDDFKAMRVRHYKNNGYTVIFCGDGRSDVKAALSADIVFARANLLKECLLAGVPARELKSFKAVADLIRSQNVS